MGTDFPASHNQVGCNQHEAELVHVTSGASLHVITGCLCDCVPVIDCPFYTHWFVERDVEDFDNPADFGG